MGNRSVILKALCAALVACFLLPMGTIVFAYLDIPIFPFTTLEAVVSATLGFRMAELLG